ncbi:BSD domain-containing protein 1 isoform X1 [Hydra vulgaris]|uniref:BSD domain-containing protein 1 isoform X1 n=1 Tax=Hydra vulgaris TaxID=6087 RepID=UPI001F5EB8C1|nr:BSD domain-containing protein 1 [Hydra vulgaris]
MAEEAEANDFSEKKKSSDGSWWNSWGQGWVDAVKEKSAMTLQMVKKDLSEFVDVIQGDTLVAISETASKLDNNLNQEQPSTSAVVKKGISKFLHTVSDLITSPPDDTNDEIITLSDSFSLENYSRKQEILQSIQLDQGTYCNEPDGLFLEWLDTFNLDNHKSEMSELLIHNSSVRAIYTQLVPEVVSHTIFWQRYFYKVHLLESEEKRRKDVLARVTTEDLNTRNDEGWDDDDDDKEEISNSTNQLTDKNDVNYKDTDQNEVIDKIENQNVLNQEANKNGTVNSIDIVKSSEMDLQQTIVSEIPALDTKTRENLLTNNTEDSLDSQVDFSKICEEIQNPVIDANSSADFDKDVVDSIANVVQLINLPDQINISCETIDSENFPDCSKLVNEDTKKLTCSNRVQQLHNSYLKNELSETSSLSSWMSIDDVIKVKVVGDLSIKESSAGSDSSANGVLVNKIDSDELEDFDLDLDEDNDEDVNDEELEKMVKDIKNKSLSGDIQENDDDDWENWE